MNIRICFKPVRIGGGKDQPKSTYELHEIDDRILKDYLSYLQTGQPHGGAYGESHNDHWFHVDFREVAFMVPIEDTTPQVGGNPLAGLADLPGIPGLHLR